MAMKNVAWLSEEAPPFRRPDAFPEIPATDNEPGAPEALLRANKLLRGRRWPSPYDRTQHQMILGDGRDLRSVASESVHLVVTSPPYFNLKPYASGAGGAQLGRIDDYETFLGELDRAWRECARVLVPGGRICCVIGDILIPRRADGRHRVLPLPSDIQVRSRSLGLDNLTPILWFKIGNRTNEAGGGSSGYYGKPYQPGAIIKNDHEHIVMLRKPGGYRATPMIQKALSMLQRDEMDAWMRPVWSDIRGASLRDGHPAPFPPELAERLIRMFRRRYNPRSLRRLGIDCGGSNSGRPQLHFGGNRGRVPECCDAPCRSGSGEPACREPYRDRDRIDKLSGVNRGHRGRGRYERQHAESPQTPSP